MEILSPLPGTFYRKPSPEAEEFIKIGQSVKEGDVIGLIEVMKQYTELTAEKSGVVKDILVEDGDSIESGQVLVVIE